MKGFLLLCSVISLAVGALAYEPVTLYGTIIWTQIDQTTFKFNYTEAGWATMLVGWIEFPEDPTTMTEKVVPIFIGHGNAFDVDLYLNQYCSAYFYSRGYMCFGPTLTHVIACPNLGAGLSSSDCSDSPENLKRSVRTIDILFSSAFQEKFGDLIELDSLVGFGHSYGSYLMTALTPIETRFTSAVIMSGGKKFYGTQYSDEYYANTSIPLLRLHGANDSLVPVAQEADETEILRKGGVENFFLALNGQGHAWVISTVGGVMHNWFRTYDPRNNSAVIPVLESMEQNGNIVYLRGHGFGTNNNGFSMIFDDSSLPYKEITGEILSWSDTEVSFSIEGEMSSSYIVANADSADFATNPVIDHFGGVFSRKHATMPQSGPLNSPIGVHSPSAGNSPSASTQVPVKVPNSISSARNNIADTLRSVIFVIVVWFV